MRWSSACLALSLLSSTLAVDVQGALQYNFFLKNTTELRPGVKVVLNHGQRSAFLRQDGSFVIPDVEAGEYALDVISNTHAFEPLYLTVQPDSNIHVQAYHPLILPSPPTSSPTSLPYPIQIHPKLRLSDAYYDPNPSSTGNLLALLKSPMVLMMIFTAIMAFAAPKLLENMEVDPEDAKSVRDMREKFQNVGSTDWGEKLAGKLAGVPEPSDAPPMISASVGPTPSVAAGGNNNKRRKGR